MSDTVTDAPQPAPADDRDRTKRIFNPKASQNFQQLTVTALASIGAVILALAIAAAILWLSGYDWTALFEKMGDNLQNSDKRFEMLNRATPLMISAVAVAIGFKMNLFNIGVEGQFMIGLFFAAVIGPKIDLPAPLHVTVILLTAMVTGAAWASIAAILKVRRGVNEVIVTIMLNMLALNLIAFLFTEYFQYTKPGSQDLDVKTKLIPESGWIPAMFGDKLTGVFLLALVVVLFYWLLVFKSRFGYRLRASGVNASAASTGGIAAKRMIVAAMLMSGAIAGLVGMTYLLGDEHAYGPSRPDQYGFNGIAVALLGRNHPVGIVISALLFGFLDSLTGPLQIAKIPVSIVYVIKAVILLTVVIVNEVVTVRVNRRTADRTAAQLAVAGVAA